MRAILFILFFILLLVSIVNTVEALRQAVGEIIIDIKPGQTKTFEWLLASDNEEEVITVELSAEGVGSEFLSFDDTVEINPLEVYSTSISVIIPEDYPGGIELKPKMFATEPGTSMIGNMIIEIAMEKTVNLNISPNDDPNLRVDWEAFTKADLEEPLSPALETTDEEDKSLTQGQGGCLIATATYGSELAPQVQLLREIRENTILKTQSGTTFMTGFNQFYYLFSPTIADYERQNPVFKQVVKLTITPLLASLSLLNYVDLDSEESVLGYGIGIILMNVGMYFVAPAVVIHIIKNKK